MSIIKYIFDKLIERNSPSKEYMRSLRKHSFRISPQ